MLRLEGMHKLKPKERIWACRSLHYPHQGGHAVRLLRPPNFIEDEGYVLETTTQFMTYNDGTQRSVNVTLPDEPCTGCMIQFKRQVSTPVLARKNNQYSGIVFLSSCKPKRGRFTITFAFVNHIPSCPDVEIATAFITVHDCSKQTRCRCGF